MSQGKIVQIIGPVVDVEFPRDAMPKVYDALKLKSPELTFEVQQQLGDGVVRTIAMGTTDGLQRGMVVTQPADLTLLDALLDGLGRYSTWMDRGARDRKTPK